MNVGWICLHRGWRENPLFDGPFSRADAWVWLIEKACWKPTNHDIKGKNITLQRGQICVSRDQLAREWGWSPSAVERFLARLQSEQMIERESGQGKTIVTLCNYSKYQDFSDRAGQESEQPSEQSTGQQKNKGTSETRYPSNPNGLEGGGEGALLDPLFGAQQEKRDRKRKSDKPAIVFNGSGFDNISDEQISLWEAAYPAVKVRPALTRAAAWLDANPANQKSNYKRFLVNWLSREQDRAPRVASTPAGNRPGRTPAPENFTGYGESGSI